VDAEYLFSPGSSQGKRELRIFSAIRTFSDLMGEAENILNL
jgi:hypothetical protein